MKSNFQFWPGVKRASETSWLASLISWRIFIGIYNMKRSYNAYFAPLFDKEKNRKNPMSNFEKTQTGKPLASLSFLKRSWP